MKKAPDEKHPKAAAITHQSPITPVTQAAPPRAEGRIALSAKPLGKRSVIEGFRQSGSYKCLFPHGADTHLDAVLLNTAGGVTGGDRFLFSGKAASGTTMTLTTQACERAYKAQPGQTGRIRNTVTVEPNARVNWLPQETILFNGSALDRRLIINLAPKASALMVEPLVFGRPAMGEVLTDIHLQDRIEIRRSDTPIFIDALSFEGDLNAHLSRPTIANGAGAMALIVFASPTAEGQLDPIRKLLPTTGGASLLHDDLLVIRLLADDSFTLRRTLMPILRRLNNDTLPRCWML